MKKHNKFLRSLLAIVIAILMVGSVIPTVAFAADAEENTSAVGDILNSFEAFIQSIKDFFQRIIDFFRDLFGCKDDEIPVAVEAVTADTEKITLMLTETETATATVTVAPANATNKEVEWKSANEAVVTVDAKGKITAIGRGRTTITATSKDDPTKSDTIAVEVRDPEAIYVTDPQELKDAMLERDVVLALDADIVVTADTPTQWGSYMFVANGREVTIDLNGYNIIFDETADKKVNAMFTTANGGTLNIIGDGTLEVKNGKAGIFWGMNKNDQINIYGGTFISNSDNGSDALAILYTNSGNIDVYGGKFVPLDGVTCANAEDAQGNRLSIVFHEGTLLKHTIYYAGYDATRIQLAEGCELAEVEIDGETWYKVVKQ